MAWGGWVALTFVFPALPLALNNRLDARLAAWEYYARKQPHEWAASVDHWRAWSRGEVNRMLVLRCDDARPPPAGPARVLPPHTDRGNAGWRGVQSAGRYEEVLADPSAALEQITRWWIPPEAADARAWLLARIPCATNITEGTAKAAQPIEFGLF